MGKFYTGIVSNESIILDTKASKLYPSTELIIITSEPKWIREKDTIKKHQISDEFRFSVTIESIGNLIEFLEKTRQNMHIRQSICDKNIIKMVDPDEKLP